MCHGACNLNVLIVICAYLLTYDSRIVRTTIGKKMFFACCTFSYFVKWYVISICSPCMYQYFKSDHFKLSYPLLCANDVEVAKPQCYRSICLASAHKLVDFIKHIFTATLFGKQNLSEITYMHLLSTSQRLNLFQVSTVRKNIFLRSNFCAVRQKKKHAPLRYS